MAAGILYFVSAVIVIGIAALIGCLAIVIDEKWTGPLAKRLRQSRNQPIVPSALSRRILAEDAELQDLYESNQGRLWTRIDRYVNEAGVSKPLLVALVVVQVLTLYGIALYFGIPLKVYLPLLTVPFIVTPLWIMARHKRRIVLAESQLPGALQVICSAMRAGQSLDGAIESASTSQVGLLSIELKQVSNALSLGVPVDEALTDLSSRIGSSHISYVTAAIRMQQRLGGDLTKLLDKVGETVRLRFEVINNVKALSAEGRLSGAVLMVMPLMAFGVMFYLAPEYVLILVEDSIGQKLLWGTFFLQLLGVIVIRRICNKTA